MATKDQTPEEYREELELELAALVERQQTRPSIYQGLRIRVLRDRLTTIPKE